MAGRREPNAPSADGRRLGGKGEFVEGCRGTESNRRHGDFQSPALPTELPRLSKRVVFYQKPVPLQDRPDQLWIRAIRAEKRGVGTQALQPAVSGRRLRGRQESRLPGCSPGFSTKWKGPRRGEVPGPSGRELQLTRTAICLGFAACSLGIEMLRTPFFSSAETFSRSRPRGSRKERWKRPCHLWTWR